MPSRVLVPGLYLLQLGIVAAAVVAPFLWICGGPRLASRTFRGLARSVGDGALCCARVGLLFCVNTLALLVRLAGSIGDRERILEACAGSIERMGDSFCPNRSRD